MSYTTTLALPENKQIAFIQLSNSSQLHEDCWAEPGQRVLVVGFRKGESTGTRHAIGHFAEKNAYVEESCLGTKIAGKYKAIMADDPARIRGFLEQLEKEGVLSEAEKNKAVHHFGVRGQRLHPFIKSEIYDSLGSGI